MYQIVPKIILERTDKMKKSKKLILFTLIIAIIATISVFILNSNVEIPKK